MEVEDSPNQKLCTRKPDHMRPINKLLEPLSINVNLHNKHLPIFSIRAQTTATAI